MRSPGGCDFLETPSLDARDADPVWLADPDPLISLEPSQNPDADPFSLWGVAGRKSLVHDGQRMVLRATSDGRVLHAAISTTLHEGMACAYAVPTGARARRKLDAIAALESLTTAKGRRHALTRSDLVHMRALQSLDVEQQGAAEIDIARLVFGETLPADEFRDSALRARVRYHLNHGHRYRNGDYLLLLRNASAPASPDRRRIGHRAKPPSSHAAASSSLP